MYYFVRFIKKTLRYLLKPLSFIPALIMMYVIFNFSGQDGNESAQLSREVSRILVLAYNRLAAKHYDNTALEILIETIHPYVRKGAHITEYFVLAMAVGLPMWVYRIRGFGLMLLDSAFCVCFAALDEFHQSFISGRVSDPKDVLIDSIGIFVGVIVIRIVCYIGKNTMFKWLVLE